jgi:hypothetical protein
MKTMNEQIYDDMAIEKRAEEHFGATFDIDHVIVRQIDVGRSVHATVFMTKKKQLFAYIAGESRLSLGDVEKIVSRMGLKAELYYPPRHHPDYFDTIGQTKFREVFPGRNNIHKEDILFYRTLAPYNPALILISEVKNGEIYQYDSDARTKWRVAAKFSYRRILTS